MEEELESENQVKDPEHEQTSFKVCPNFGRDKLDLSCTSLSSVPVHVLTMTYVQYLYLQDNNICEIPSRLCESLVHLIWLDLRRNALTIIPKNINLLTQLKHLLLEGNQIEQLPLELGQLEKLTGLNLRNNPLKFPEADIIAEGTKKILAYLREYNTQLENDGETDKKTVDANDSQQTMFSQHRNSKIELKKKQSKRQNPVGYYADDISDCGRRQSLEENMLDLLQYSVNSLEIKERNSAAGNSVPAMRTKNLFSDAFTKRKSASAKDLTLEDKGGRKKSYTSTSSDKVSIKFEQELKRAEIKKQNDQTNKTLQARKNKRMLDDWRRNKKGKSNKLSAMDTKHDIVIPYGTDDLKLEPEEKRSPQLENEELKAKTQPSSVGLSLDEQLEQRIKQHVKNIREWRRRHNNVTLEEQLSTTGKNLEKAQILQKEIREKRAKEYRFRAFTGGEYVPPAHTT